MYEVKGNRLEVKGEDVVRVAQSLLNVPYLWGGKNMMGYDCSGFTQTVYSVFGINLLRNAREQVTQGQVVSSLAEAQPGDLVFFDHLDRNPEATKITHVGMLGVRVMGIIDIQVLVSGTLFTGRNIEPITTAADPYQNIDFGVPFTGRPTALMLDYKCVVEQESWYWFAKGTAKPKKREFENGEIDEAEAYIYLQHRWEDEKGKIHSIRVGTGYERFSKTQTEWVNAHRIPIHYGDITGEPWYKDYMGFKGIERAMNSRGKITLIQEEGWDGTLEPTHMVIVITSGKMEAFEGHEGNTLWVDNVGLVY